MGAPRLMAVPMALLVSLAAWHFYSHLTTEALGSLAQHAGIAGLAMAMGAVSLYLRGMSGEAARYVEGQVSGFRAHLIGGACLVLGGLHFISTPEEGVFLKMGYLTLALACFEAAGIAELFLPAMRGEPAPVTIGTLKRVALRQAALLACVFLLSAVLLYMSLMVVVGFVDTWTVGLLAAMMLAALAFMARLRRL